MLDRNQLFFAEKWLGVSLNVRHTDIYKQPLTRLSSV